MILTTAHGVIQRSPTTLQRVYYSKSLGLCVEYLDSTGKHTLTGVKEIKI